MHGGRDAGQTISLEVKTDQFGYKTRNLALETCVDLNRHKKGCLWTTDASIVIFVLTHSHECKQPLEVVAYEIDRVRQ